MNRIRVLLLIGLVVETLVLAWFYLHESVGVVGNIGFPLDDSWIHSHLARNWAEGNGMSYNPGHPVSSTTILYTLILGVMFKIAVSPIIDAIILGLCLHIATAYVIYLTARRLDASNFIAIIAAILFAATPRLIWGAIGGMEVPLYVFLVTLGIYHHLLYRWDNTPRAYLSTLWFGLSILARPECGVFLVLALIDRGISASRSHNLTRYIKTLPWHICLAVLLLLPWGIFNWSYSGHLLPPTFYAKVPSIPDWAIRATLLWQYLVQAVIISIRDNFLLAIGAIAGMVLFVRKAFQEEAGGELLLSLPFIVMPIAISQFAASPTVGQQLIGQNGRYSAYFVPLLVLMATVGLSTLSKLVSRRSLLSRSIIATIIILPVFGISANNNYLAAKLYAYQVQNIDSMQVQIGKWAATLPPGTLIACNDVGAIGYFSRQPVIDTVGIVNPEVLPYLYENGNAEAGLWKYLSKRKPEYLIIFPNWYPAIASRPELEFFDSYSLEYNFVCGGPQMVVFKPNWK